LADKIYLGENAQSFKTSPKFSTIDMVILNLDENTYISSPYVTLDEEVWEESWQRRYNGKYIFSYDATLNDGAGGWKQTAGPYYFSGSSVDLEAIGITAVFNVPALAEKAGDQITVNRFAESKTTDNPEPQIEINIELTRSGRTMEASCPLCKPDQRQGIADSLLESLSGYQYQPFSAVAAEVNPLAELGDGITLHGIYGGLYQQELEFSSLMSSDIGAPGEEETDHEFTYETANERKYSRKFADISAEFEIHATEIAARVTKEGTGDGFSWSLVYDGFSVSNGNKVVWKVDKDGAEIDGTIKATDGIIGGFTIGANAIYKDIDTFGSEEKTSGVYLGTNGIQLGKQFKVDSRGAVTASNLIINGGSINLGKYSNNGSDDYRFKVTSNGYVYATSLYITGGSIDIGNGKFRVDSAGNLYATSGTFSGNVYAGNIQYGGSYGTFSGAGLTAGSIGFNSYGALGSSWYNGALGGTNFTSMGSDNFHCWYGVFGNLKVDLNYNCTLGAGFTFPYGGSSRTYVPFWGSGYMVTGVSGYLTCAYSDVWVYVEDIYGYQRAIPRYSGVNISTSGGNATLLCGTQGNWVSV